MSARPMKLIEPDVALILYIILTITGTSENEACFALILLAILIAACPF
jgi:hypothetical protein